MRDLDGPAANPAPVADDALTRKDAEMGKMTEARLAWARECGRNNLPCPSDREFDAFNEGFRRAQALSLESVREEALEKAIKRCEVVRDSSDRLGGHYMGAIDCIAALRALQSPARVAEWEPESVKLRRIGDAMSAAYPKPESPAKEQQGERWEPRESKPSQIWHALIRLHEAIKELGLVGFDKPAADKDAYSAWLELNNAQVQAATAIMESHHDKTLQCALSKDEISLGESPLQGPFKASHTQEVREPRNEAACASGDMVSPKEQPGGLNAERDPGWNDRGIAHPDAVSGEPDVAAMVKRLRDACVDYDGSQEVDAAEAVHPPTCGMLRKAAALLEKIGQQRQSESEHPSNYEFPPERP